MGPYISQKDTPLGKVWQEQNPNLDSKAYNRKLFCLSTKMVALARILCGDVNIAATTALQAINPQGNFFRYSILRYTISMAQARERSCAQSGSQHADANIDTTQVSRRLPTLRGQAMHRRRRRGVQILLEESHRMGRKGADPARVG